MKQSLLQFSIFFFASMLAFQSQAQVTITESSFPRPASFIDSVYYTPQSGITYPAEGPNQVWDYSTLATTELRMFDHFDATSSPNFPDALNLYYNDLTFQGYYIQNDAYEALDANGWYNPGNYIYDVTHSITAVTGGPSDILRFVGGPVTYEGRINVLQFPMTYGDQWTGSDVRSLDFELTVAAFGLNNTPGSRERFTTQEREIVGHGQVILPQADGSATPPIEVLMLKMNRVQVDSFFLGGAPAPLAILDAFGLTQGSTVVDSFYAFYGANFGGVVLNINMEGSEVTSAFFRPQAASQVTATRDLNLSAINYFPNPVAAGETMTVITEKPITLGYVSFTDLAGRKVFQTTFEAAGNQFQIDIPAATGKGLYFYHVLDQKEIPVGLGKLQVN